MELEQTSLDELLQESQEKNNQLQKNTFWSRNKRLIILICSFIVVIWILSIGYFFYKLPNVVQLAPVPPSENTACPLDAKICPGGTAVGRSGPNCEFAACP